MTAYILAEVEVADPATYGTYTAQVQACLTPFEGHFAVRGGAVTPLEGAAPAGRIVLLAFPSAAQAEGFWNSPSYRAIVPIRQASAAARVFMVEGVSG